MVRTDSLHITPEILTLIAGINEFKGAWRALGALPSDRLFAQRRVATIESVGSSTRISGCWLNRRIRDSRVPVAVSGTNCADAGLVVP